jgi:hypothetical protein
MISKDSINKLTSCSMTETLDIDGKVWYNDYSDIDIENLTLKESYEVVRD